MAWVALFYLVQPLAPLQAAAVDGKEGEGWWAVVGGEVWTQQGGGSSVYRHGHWEKKPPLLPSEKAQWRPGDITGWRACTRPSGESLIYVSERRGGKKGENSSFYFFQSKPSPSGKGQNTPEVTFLGKVVYPYVIYTHGWWQPEEGLPVLLIHPQGFSQPEDRSFPPESPLLRLCNVTGLDNQAPDDYTWQGDFREGGLAAFQSDGDGEADSENWLFYRLTTPQQDGPLCLTHFFAPHQIKGQIESADIFRCQQSESRREEVVLVTRLREAYTIGGRYMIYIYSNPAPQAARPVFCLEYTTQIPLYRLAMSSCGLVMGWDEEADLLPLYWHQGGGPIGPGRLFLEGYLRQHCLCKAEPPLEMVHLLRNFLAETDPDRCAKRITPFLRTRHTGMIKPCTS